MIPHFNIVGNIGFKEELLLPFNFVNRIRLSNYLLKTSFKMLSNSTKYANE